MEPSTPEKQQTSKKPSKFKQLRSQIDPVTQKIWNEEQAYLRDTKLIEKDDFEWTADNVRLIAGVDISFSGNFDDVACSALVVYDTQKQAIVYEDYQVVHLDLPYVPGFLAFRQLPSLVELFKKLKLKKPQFWPQMVLVDGNGIIHPNRFGLACHLGVVVNIPTAGCGKTFFYVDGLSKDKIYKDCEDALKKKGDYVNLVGKSGKIWAAGVKGSEGSDDPLFVSVGHRISLETAIAIVVKLCKFRIPEPVRQADGRSRQQVKKITQEQAKNAVSYPMIFVKPK